jgi:hypothetical protein
MKIHNVSFHTPLVQSVHYEPALQVHIISLTCDFARYYSQPGKNTHNLAPLRNISFDRARKALQGRSLYIILSRCLSANLTIKLTFDS